jgi:hypothetical protein
MQLLARYTRIYALSSITQTTPRSHVASPVRFVDFPSPGIQSEIHIGAVPDDVIEALKCQHAWLERVFRGGCKNAAELHHLAANISEATVLFDRREHYGRSLQPHWYVTFCIDDHVELPEDPKQELLGVDIRSWLDLDNPAFFEKHTETLDQLAVQMAISLAPYRYRWRVWDGPIIHLPTGIALRPPQLRMGRIRAFGAPSLETINISILCVTSPSVFKTIPMVLHFYLRSAFETDRISRFFDAFRGLEGLCQSLETNLRSRAISNCATVTSSAPKAAQTFQKQRKSLRKSFATMALVLNPTEADADLDMFSKLYDWRIDLAHGKRKLQPDDAPDEEAFELLHKYIAKVT